MNYKLFKKGSKHMFKAVASMLVVTYLAVSTVHAEDTEFSKLGSGWLGGGISYMSSGAGGDRLRIIQAAPILRYFPLDHLMVGPSISYTGIYYDGDNVHQFSVGAEIGGVFNFGGTVIPYIRSGGSLAITGMFGRGAYAAFSVPIAGGLIIPLGKIFGFQIEACTDIKHGPRFCYKYIWC
ncbi:MAG: hypothetical protein GX640_18625 [Fibrobacter sp.]|nr:hypothetical protein [Fibrobacter sp.]